METKYYILSNSLNNEVVGSDYPQVDCLTINQAHLITSWHLFDPKPNLRFQLRKRAKLTDVLKESAISSTGFLINEKFKCILDDCNIMRHQYFNAKITNKENELNYYWLHLTQPELSKRLDYVNSIFYRTEWTFREEPIEINSYEHYTELKSKDHKASFGVGLDKIVLSKVFDKTLDMFTFLPFDNNIYISEKLKTKIEINNIKGFNIEETTKF